jgi:uncharacterized membrane protein
VREDAMSSVGHRSPELSVLMLLRRLGFGRNPLRRRVDRLESVLLLSILLAALLAIPGAAVLGTTVRDRAESTAAQQRMVLHQVDARTLEDTAQTVPSSPGEVTSRVRIAWVDTSGSVQEGWADVLIGTRAGTIVTIWLDRTGAVARAPREPADSTALGTAVGVGVLMIVWPALWGLFSLARRRLDRRRAQAWELEWGMLEGHPPT